MLVVSDQLIEEVDGAQSLDSGRDRDSRGQNAISEQRCPTDHGREEEPLAAAAHKAVEREDAPLIMVVGLHGDHDVFYGCDEGNRPDEQ